MFRENTSHNQRTLFDIERELPARKKKKLELSEEYNFYQLVFRKIKEKDFEGMFSKTGSRPNAPVNTLISSIILANRKGWTIKELFDQIDFNILTRAALGLNNIDETPFCPATFFNFQNRLLSHYIKTGENLLERVFDTLTSGQLKKLKIKTNIQRTDSFNAMSNIRSYGRVHLLIEILIRLYRILKKKDQKKYRKCLRPYMSQTSGQYMYKLERRYIPRELEKLGNIYHKLYRELKKGYGKLEIYRILERVYHEHFTEVDEKIEVKPNKDMHSGMLQSPDDIDATYRKKGKKVARGQSVNVTETSNPQNDLNLITDIAVRSNNTDDSKILNERLDAIKEKTPELEELHTDGAYSSEDNDKKMEKLGITQIQTGVKGRKSKVDITIEDTDDGEYQVACPRQKVKSERTATRNKACFNKKICDKCLEKTECPMLDQPGCKVYYFDYAKYLANKRKQKIKELPPDKQKIRPNVEATIKEFGKPFNNKGKLRVRGLFKTMMYAFGMGISINFGRIHRYISDNPELSHALGLLQASGSLILTIFFNVMRKIYNYFGIGVFEIKNRRMFIPWVWRPTGCSSGGF